MTTEDLISLDDELDRLERTLAVAYARTLRHRQPAHEWTREDAETDAAVEHCRAEFARLDAEAARLWTSAAG
jgi:hypothetical protein